MNAVSIAPTNHVVGPRLSIDLDAVAANTRLFVGRAAGEIMAVVKADGLGHGAADVARTALANGATRLGVTSIGEAVGLRFDGLTAPVLSWLNAKGADWDLAVRYDVELAVPSVDHLEAIERTTTGARIHLHLDTGMARDGASPSDWAELCRAARVAERRGRLQVVGVMGHLGCADDPSEECNRTARQLFDWGVGTAWSAGLRPQHRHLAATAATLTDPDAHHTMSRIGAGLVGIDPSRTVALKPALTLRAPLVSVRTVGAGTPVGYGHAWTAPAATRLGLLPVGYADGLPRIASGRAEVLVGGQRRPLVGRISMDMAVVDLGDAAVTLGDDVVILGPGHAGEPTVREWAAWADTIEHEIVTGLGARLQRTTSVAATRPDVLRTV
ncbi:alanine racemase [Nocardioides sp. Soil805]|uniref:alanine racemase n=1 Tax=Nocardioides sp. Soil805 TaxID=1736416 RepID=UPI0007037A75|nr:alanine racemase [Nocardioides sp. Soil805]KRF32315.1 alanine racemase [Nocardioides sp. Soil805]